MPATRRPLIDLEIRLVVVGSIMTTIVIVTLLSRTGTGGEGDAFPSLYLLPDIAILAEAFRRFLTLFRADGIHGGAARGTGLAVRNRFILVTGWRVSGSHHQECGTKYQDHDSSQLHGCLVVFECSVKMKLQIDRD